MGNVELVIILCAGVAVTHDMLRRDVTRRFMRGVHISRPLSKMIGQARAQWVRLGMSAGAALLITFSSPFHLGSHVMTVVAIWVLDDVLTGDDDDREKRDVFAGVRKWAGALRPVAYRTSTGAA